MSDQQHLIRSAQGRPDPTRRSAGLLMTATLTPPASAVARFDPQARLSDYLDALRFYLQLPDNTIDRILFVENSASDLAPLIELASTLAHNKVVEFVDFSGNDRSPERGKAYGEFELMDHGLARTTLFAADDVVWKTTGRLKFLNLPPMARALDGRAFDFVADLHNVPWAGAGTFDALQHMALRVFAFRPKAYNQVVRGLWQTVKHGLSPVHFCHAIY